MKPEPPPSGAGRGAPPQRAVLQTRGDIPGVELHTASAQGVAHSVHESCTDSARAVAHGAAFGIFYTPSPTPGLRTAFVQSDAHGVRALCANTCARRCVRRETYGGKNLFLNGDVGLPNFFLFFEILPP